MSSHTPEDERAFRRLIKLYTSRRDWIMVQALLRELGYRWERSEWERSESGSAAVGAVLILSAFTVFLFALTWVTR